MASRKRDIINTIGTFFQIISWVGTIYKYFPEENKKNIDESYGVYSMIELGVYEWAAIFLCITSFLLIYNKGWTQRHLDRFMGYIDEFTGKAKAEREYRKWLELENRKEAKTKRLENKEEKAKIEEENKKREEQSLYIKLLKVDFNCDYHFDDQDRKYYIARSIEILKKLGFVVPSISEQSYPSFEDIWPDFLGRTIVSLEIETEKQNLKIWNEISHDLPPF